MTEEGHEDGFAASIKESEQGVACGIDTHTALPFLGILVTDISGIGQYVQCTLKHKGVIMEETTKLSNIELTRHMPAITYCQLIIAADILIYIADIIHVGITLTGTSLRILQLLAVQDDYAAGRKSVATGTTSLLKVFLDAVGDIQVNHKAHIGLVYTHTEGTGGHHDSHLVLYP